MPNPSTFTGSGFSFNLASSNRLYGTGGRVEVDSPNGTLTFSQFSSGVNAVGGYLYFNDQDNVATGTITGNNGVDAAATLSVPAGSTSRTVFYGFISSSGPMTSLVFSQNNNVEAFAGVNAFIVGQDGSSGVPEPATLGLSGAALAALCYFRSRR